MTFHLGKPILVMIVVALLSGALTNVRPKQVKPDLVLWVFAQQHQKVYETLVAEFHRRTGLSVEVKLVAWQAMDLRLSGLFMTDATSRDLPDLAEIEISWVGKYFRPPVDDIGFVPLN